MKLLVLLLVCALAAADREEGWASPEQVTVALGHLYRRFLHAVHPKQLELQDALEMRYSNGMMAGKPFTSSVKGTFDTRERATFSYITSLVNPGQKGVADDGPWLKQDACDIIVTHHYGDPIKVHMVTNGGIHKEVVVGSPLDDKNAKFVAVIPKATYFILESVSEENANFHSYISVPAWEQTASTHFHNNEMEAKFPDHADMFRELEKPGVRHHHDHRDDHHDDNHDDHDEHGHLDHGKHGRFRHHRR